MKIRINHLSGIILVSIIVFLIIAGCVREKSAEKGDGIHMSPNPQSRIEVEEPSADAVVPEKPEIDFVAMKSEVKKITLECPAEIGVVVLDPETGEKLEINHEMEFESASLVKIPIMYQVFRGISSGEIDSELELELLDTQKAGGSGLLKNEPEGSRWKVVELVNLMITESDNTATDMLIDLVGMGPVENTCKGLGAVKTTLRRKIYDFDRIDLGYDNQSTPQDMAIILKEIYTQYKNKDNGGRQMMSILMGQKNRSMIPSLLPEGVGYAGKTGGLSGVLHDCAVIFPEDGGPYILVIMGRNVSDAEGTKKVYGEISRVIFGYLRKDV